MVDWGLVVGIVGVGDGVWSDVKRRGERAWVHMALANLKPSIQGGNSEAVITAINNKMAFLKPPPKQNADAPSDLCRSAAEFPEGPLHGEAASDLYGGKRACTESQFVHSTGTRVNASWLVLFPTLW